MKKLSITLRRLIVNHTTLLVNVVLATFVIVNVITNDLNTAFAVCGIQCMINAVIVWEMYLGIGLRDGMVFKDGNIMCKITKDKDNKKILCYRNLFLIRANYNKKSGWVLYKTYVRKASIMQPDSYIGTMVYNVHEKYLITIHDKIIKQIN